MIGGGGFLGNEKTPLDTPLRATGKEEVHSWEGKFTWKEISEQQSKTIIGECKCIQQRGKIEKVEAVKHTRVVKSNQTYHCIHRYRYENG